jgi:hypothetical protein
MPLRTWAAPPPTCREVSYEATQFRIWATKTLREFIVNVLDDERLKQGKQVFGKDYFDELLERIREIRASERRFYQKITDLDALAVDYDPNAPLGLRRTEASAASAAWQSYGHDRGGPH